MEKEAQTNSSITSDTLSEISSRKASISSDSERLCISERFLQRNPKNPLKQSRMPYSKIEKRALIDYVIRKKEYQYLKGTRFWKKAEKDNICPIRSWQSLRNHFIRTMVKELSLYNIPARDAHEIRRRFQPKTEPIKVKNQPCKE